MSTPESGSMSKNNKSRYGFKGFARDATIFTLGAGFGAFGMKTFLNQTDQIRSEAEVAAAIGARKAAEAAKK